MTKFLVLIGLAALPLAGTAAAQSQPTEDEVTKATTVFQLCVEASRDQSWAQFSPESVPSDYPTTTSPEGPNYAAWAKSYLAADTKITQSCKVAYPYDIATICRWVPECDAYLVERAGSVISGTTICDKSSKKCRPQTSAR
jgi:hypothetical protein